MSESFQVLDITNTTEFDEKVSQYFFKIASGHDKLKDNYANYNKKMFSSLTVAIDTNNQIIAVSGLQIDSQKWGPQIGRILSRMSIDPEYRYKGLDIFKDKVSFSEKMIPIQIKAARLFNLDSVFFSRQKGYLSTKKLCEKIEKRLNGLKFEISNNPINVCGPLDPVPNECLQYVAKLHLTTSGPSAWNKFENTVKI